MSIPSALVMLMVLGTPMAASGCAGEGADEGAVDQGAGGGPASGGLPIGIPAPSFGMTERAGATTLTVTGTDSIPNPIPAGSVIEITGVYTRTYGESATLQCEGTQASPAFIRGAAGSKVQAGFQVSGSYCIFENLDFEPGGFLVKSPADHVVLRNSDVSGTPTSGGTAVVNWSASDIHDILFWKNQIHDNGNWQILSDQDNHGTQVGRNGGARYGSTYNVWILENTYYHNSGSGVQVIGNTDGQAKLHHIYIGRNVAHHNKQTGFSTKQASDVIFSENHSYSARPSPSSVGSGLSGQYSPNRVWYLYNKIHDTDVGIRVASNLGSHESQIYLIGNVAWNVHSTTGFNPNTGWANACWSIVGGTSRYIINNTCYDADSGYRSPSAGSHLISGNIFADIIPEGAHMFVETRRAQVTARNNLTDEGARTKNAECSKCVVGNPGFANPVAGDLTLTPASAAVDKGVEEDVYATFQKLYGLDIRRDAAGRPRPSGGGWDIGAYER